MFGKHKSQMVSPEDALPGRTVEMPVPTQHFVNFHPLTPPFPDGLEQAVFGMGCFWGAERKFWEADGVFSTAVGYAGGYTPNPTYEEVCSARTGHTEVVLVVFDPAVVELRGDPAHLLGEPRPDPGHAPGQRRRHAVPLGDLHVLARAAASAAESSRDAYQKMLSDGRLRRRSPPRSPTRRPSITPRTTTSSTWPRTRAATAASAARAWPAPPA